MNVSDIKDGLAHRDLRATQEAFRALVTGDDIVEGVEGGGEEAAALLQQVAGALGQDTSPLPGDVAAFIDDETGGSAGRASYSAGAAAVLASMPRFNALLADRYPEPIEGE